MLAEFFFYRFIVILNYNRLKINESAFCYPFGVLLEDRVTANKVTNRFSQSAVSEVGLLKYYILSWHLSRVTIRCLPFMLGSCYQVFMHVMRLLD